MFNLFKFKRKAKQQETTIESIGFLSIKEYNSFNSVAFIEEIHLELNITRGLNLLQIMLVTRFINDDNFEAFINHKQGSIGIRLMKSDPMYKFADCSVQSSSVTSWIEVEDKKIICITTDSLLLEEHGGV